DSRFVQTQDRLGCAFCQHLLLRNQRSIDIRYYHPDRLSRASIFRCHLLTSFVGIRLSWPGLSPASTNPIPADSLLLLVVPQQTAVDKERGARNVVGFLGSQETGQTCNIFRFPEPRK